MAEGTRIDKYLWAIRVFKTRTDATDACKGGKVRLNGNDVKPSRTVACGDIINVRKGATPQEELDKLRHPVETFFLKRDPGTGRPTKKDRRQMELLWDSLDFDVPDDVADGFADEFDIDD